MSYELRVNSVLRNLPDVFVCTYNLNHHSARTIADVLGIPLGTAGSRINFVHPKDAGGVLVELVEPAPDGG